MRTYDVVLFGASGFTGRQAARYFTRDAPATLRWAIAGRSRRRLEALHCGRDVIVADAHDASSIDEMVQGARVIVSTAGPFARYGTPVVDACVRHRTDYVDITGETYWVADMAARYHDRCAADEVRIVPCCGFDSVPSDLGAFLLARHHAAREVRAYFQLGGGGLNGGTIASVSSMVASGQAGGLRRGRDVMAPPHVDEWIDRWVGPFFMAPTNTWVVSRSAALFGVWREPYPDGFAYREFLKFDAPFAAAKCLGATAATAAFGAVMQVPAAYRALARVLPKPGEGPSETQMNRGWFSCDLIGETPSGKVRAAIRNQGDAGNRSTVKMLCQSALCLALGECTPRGGVLTPATAFGDHLARRLRTADMTIEW